MTQVIGWTLSILGAYLIGSVPFGYILGRMGGIDIRNWGSKNVGATNVARILGWRRGALVLALDALKGVAAMLLAQSLAGMAGDDRRALFLVISGATAILGHTFPCWLKFRGGKGVATALGVWLVLAWLPTLVALVVWGVVVAIWRYVSLGSIVAAVALPLAEYFWQKKDGSDAPMMVFAALLALLVIVKHLGNMARLAKGTESKISHLFVKQIRAPKPKT